MTKSAAEPVVDPVFIRQTGLTLASLWFLHRVQPRRRLLREALT